MTNDATRLFDRALWAARRNRAAATIGAADFLLREICDRIGERLEEVNRRFADALILDAGPGALAAAVAGRPGLDRIRQLEAAPAMAALTGAEIWDAPGEVLPVAEASADLALSALTLHAVNDLPGMLTQIRRALRPDGLFIGALFAGETLWELRAALTAAEIETTGGLSPRVAPMAEIRGLGALLQRAGFALPVADVDRLTVTYPSPLALLRDLRAMGEGNVLSERRRAFMRRETLIRTCEIYVERYGNSEGRVAATFDIAFLTGWAPAPSQPKPLRPGSAAMRLADALGSVERSTGEKPDGRPTE